MPRKNRRRKYPERVFEPRDYLCYLAYHASPQAARITIGDENSGEVNSFSVAECPCHMARTAFISNIDTTLLIAVYFSS
jgi:hypothetical protein